MRNVHGDFHGGSSSIRSLVRRSARYFFGVGFIFGFGFGFDFVGGRSTSLAATAGGAAAALGVFRFGGHIC